MMLVERFDQNCQATFVSAKRLMLETPAETYRKSSNLIYFPLNYMYCILVTGIFLQASYVRYLRAPHFSAKITSFK